jgi:hypothetical protein
MSNGYSGAQHETDLLNSSSCKRGRTCSAEKPVGDRQRDLKEWSEGLHTVFLLLKYVSSSVAARPGTGQQSTSRRTSMYDSTSHG